MKGRLVAGFLCVGALTAGLIASLPSQPSFDGATAGCSGGGCHTLTPGIVSAVAVGLNVTVTLSGTTAKVGGELVNGSGTVVSSNDGTSTNPFVLTAPGPGDYVVNAGYKSPSRDYATVNINIPDPVPIQLSSFVGLRISPRAVRLTWETISEINNYGFTVERRLSGEESFALIPNSFVAGHGTTNTPQKYEFTDEDAPTGVSDYRLAQVDLDGSVHFSESIRISSVTAVAGGIALTYELGQNYPNPFNPGTTIRYALPNSSHVTLTVFNTLGEQVALLQNGEREAGYHEVMFDASGLPSGVYFYRLTAGDFVQTKKLLVAK